MRKISVIFFCTCFEKNISDIFLDYFVNLHRIKQTKLNWKIMTHKSNQNKLGYYTCIHRFMIFAFEKSPTVLLTENRDNPGDTDQLIGDVLYLSAYLQVKPMDHLARTEVVYLLLIKCTFIMYICAFCIRPYSYWFHCVGCTYIPAAAAIHIHRVFTASVEHIFQSIDCSGAYSHKLL